MSYLYRTGNGRNNIGFTTTANSSTKYLRRTSSGRNNITWTTIPQGSTYNILQRNGTGRNNILWANLFVGVALSSKSVGTIVYIKENGTFTEFIVLNHNYPQSGRTFLCRSEDTTDAVQWINQGNSRNNEYSGSTIDNWLNNTYYNRLDTNVRSKITNVTIQYTKGNGGGLSTLSRKIFLMSTTEVGSTQDNVEGVASPYFNSDERRLGLSTASYNSYHHLYLRSVPNTDYWLYYIQGNTGKVVDTSGAGTYGYPVPAFTLPSDIPINTSNQITG